MPSRLGNMSSSIVKSSGCQERVNDIVAQNRCCVDHAAETDILSVVLNTPFLISQVL